MAEKSFFDEFSSKFTFTGFTEQMKIASNNLEQYSTKLNSTFGQTKERLGEMMTTIAQATPKITRLGGDVEDVFDTLNQITKATRKNIIANDEDAARLFATSQVLGQSVEDIVDNFANIGVTFASIPDQIEETTKYLRSIGGNTQQIMREVTFNLDRLNRFQFENGVVGLTKMAAQASLLRFNMNQTFQLADKVISPEGAVEVAAAFQRLGVTAGNLVDPFQLMNQSINDPQGLQDSLIKVAKQFSYFDEQTKTFKINPQGVLMLREIETQTGVSAAELSKAAVSAQDLERRLSQINKIGLNFSEEDKLYLANITQMTKEGQYTVNLRTEFGKMITKPLEEVTKEELEKLIEEQKSGGKTMEDVSRSQLTAMQTIAKDVEAIYQTITYGAVGASITTDFNAGLIRGATSLTGTLSGSLTRSMEGKIDDAIGALLKTSTTLFDQIKSGSFNIDKVVDEIGKIETGFEDFSKGIFKEIGKDIAKEFNKDRKSITGVENLINTGVREMLSEDLKKLAEEDIKKLTNKFSGAEQNFIGKGTTSTTTGNSDVNQNIKGGTTTTTGKIDVNGDVNVNIKIPTEFSALNTEQIKIIFNELINSTEFKNEIEKLIIRHSQSLPRQGTK
jgi:hypothetical protein